MFKSKEMKAVYYYARRGVEHNRCNIIVRNLFQSLVLNKAIIFLALECIFPMPPHVRLLVGCSVGQSVSLNFLKKAGTLLFHDPFVARKYIDKGIKLLMLVAELGGGDEVD